MNFAPPRAFARVVVALLALLLPTPARAENCGDPLSSCYVGNARAEDQERDSRQKFGQRSEYRPTPIRGQRRLDRFEPVDVIRLSPGEKPLNATQLARFWKSSEFHDNRIGNAIRFYEKHGLMHFVFRDGCAIDKPWLRILNGTIYDCSYEFDGTYYNKITPYGEEWIRCTKTVPTLNGHVTDEELGRTHVSCAAYVDMKTGVLKATDPRLEAEKVPVGGVARVGGNEHVSNIYSFRAVRESPTWLIVGADDYERSPAEKLAERKFNVPGVPFNCMRYSTGCNEQTGYDVELPSQKIRRFVTPTSDNNPGWLIENIKSRTLGEPLFETSDTWTRWSAPYEKSPYDMTGKKTTANALDHGYSFDESPAYPNTLFIGRTEYDREDTSDGIIAWDYAWENPDEEVDPGGPPTVPGKKYILGRWREPQLPWSLPRAFPPDVIARERTAIWKGYTSSRASGSLEDGENLSLQYAWDPPTLPARARDAREKIAVSSYVYLRQYEPVYQNLSVSVPENKDEKIDWAAYFAEAPSADAPPPKKPPPPPYITKLSSTVRVDNAGQNDQMGYDDDGGKAMALDGDTMVIGAPAIEKAYLFKKTSATNEWALRATLQPRESYGSLMSMPFNCKFGDNVAISDAFIAVGTGRSGKVFFYRRDATGDAVPVSHVHVGGSDPKRSLAMSKDGNTAFVGVPGYEGWSRKVFVLSKDKNTDDFSQSAVLTADDYVAQPRAYAARFDKSSDRGFGSSVAVSDDGQTLIVGAEGAEQHGAAYVFQVDESDAKKWSQVTKFKASEPLVDGTFGSAVDISGDTVVVASEGANLVYVFTRDGSTWTQRSVLVSDLGVGEANAFGRSVGIDKDTIIIGTLSNQNEAAYLYTRDAPGVVASEWSYRKKLACPGNSQTGHLFGASVDVSGDAFAVTAARYREITYLWDPFRRVMKLGTTFVFERDATADEGTATAPSSAEEPAPPKPYGPTQVGNLWHIGKPFAPAYNAPNGHYVDAGDAQPQGWETVPGGGFAVKGMSVYVDRSGKLVLSVTDRGKTFSCRKNTYPGSERQKCSPIFPSWSRNGQNSYGHKRPEECRKVCTSSDASVQTCTSKDVVPTSEWTHVASVFDGENVYLYVGETLACQVEVPNGLYMDHNDVPVYTQCEHEDCGANEPTTLMGDFDRLIIKEPHMLDHSSRAAAPFRPASAMADMYDFVVTVGDDVLIDDALAERLAERAKFEPPHPDAWKKRCQPDCNDPNLFVNHVPIPQGRWTKIPLEHTGPWKVNADGDIMIQSKSTSIWAGEVFGEHTIVKYAISLLRGEKTTCAMEGLCGDDFKNASFRGIFEMKANTSEPKFREVAKEAKVNSPQSTVFKSVEGKLLKTGDHKDFLIVGGAENLVFTWHKETPRREGGWSTTGIPLGREFIFSGRSITHIGHDYLKEFYGYADRRMLDDKNFLQLEWMPLSQDAAPTPWACTKLVNVFSPDGGFTYYGMLVAGYDPMKDPLWKCDFGTNKARYVNGELGFYDVQRALGIRRLVTDECKPLMSMNNRYGFASYLGNRRNSSTFASAGVSKPNGDFLFAGKFGPPGVLGTNLSFPRVDVTPEAKGCASNISLEGKYNDTAGSKCMSQVFTLEGAGCVEGDPSASCGHPKSISYLGAGAAGDMARAITEGSVVVYGPQGVLKLNAYANVTIWNSCDSCKKTAEDECDAMCGGAKRVKIDIGPRGLKVAVLDLKAKKLHILDAASGAEIRRVDLSLDGHGTFADVAVSDLPAHDKVFVGGYKEENWMGDNNTDPGTVKVAFVRAFDMSTGRRSWTTWDFPGSAIRYDESAHTQVNVLVVDKAGRLFVGGSVTGRELKPFFDIPIAANIFRYDGRNVTGTIKNAALYAQRRPVITATGQDKYGDVIHPRMTEFFAGSAAYVGLIEPFDGHVIRGKFLFSYKYAERVHFPLGIRSDHGSRGVHSISVTGMDIDDKGNIIFGGNFGGDVEHRDFQTTNGYPLAKASGGEPYFAIYDPNLIRRVKWSHPTQYRHVQTEDKFSAQYYMQFGGGGRVTGVVGGGYCPDDPFTFGSCTSALLIEAKPTKEMGQFYTSANALQVWGENAKWGTGCVEFEGSDCLKTDAYAALIKGPAQLGSLEYCNPLDFKEPPSMLMWAHFVNSKAMIDVKFDTDTDRGETAGLTLGGVYPCSALFDANTTAILGAKCTAVFLDKRTARVNLGENHAVIEASDGLADGSLVAIRGGVVYTDRFRDKGASSTASIMVTKRPGFPIAVKAKLSSVPELTKYLIPGCVNNITLPLRGTYSTGKLGTQPLLFKWSYDGMQSDCEYEFPEDEVKASRLRAFLASRPPTRTNVMIPESLLFYPQNCDGELYFSMVVTNKVGHVYTDDPDDNHGDKASHSVAMNKIYKPSFIISVGSGKAKSLSGYATGVSSYGWMPDECVAWMNAFTTVEPTWNATAAIDPNWPADRVTGWPTPSGLHTDVVSQEAKLAKLAKDAGLMFNVPKNMLFGGRVYSFNATFVVSYKGERLLTKTFYKKVKPKFNVIRSVVYGGNGGEYSEYAQKLRTDDVPEPGVFDETRLKPTLTRTEWLTRRAVDVTEENEIVALADARIDPDWRTDREIADHVWNCRNMEADRHGCELDMGKAPTPPKATPTNSRGQVAFWPVEELDTFEGEALPNGSPLVLPPNAMEFGKDYTFTLNSRKSLRESLPDMGILTTGPGCPFANIEPMNSRVNAQYLFRIYGSGSSNRGRVQFRWTMADTLPISASAEWSKEISTDWLDKSYFSLAKNTLVPGREYVLTLYVRLVNDKNGCQGKAQRLITVNAPPRALDGVSFEPPEGGVEFQTKFTVDCGQWIDTDESLDYRLGFWYNFDAYNARWAWLSDLQYGDALFEDVLLPHSGEKGGGTKIRCVAFDDDGAFGYSETIVPVAAAADVHAVIDKVFVQGDHREYVRVFPAALRRLQQVDKEKYAKLGLSLSSSGGGVSSSITRRKLLSESDFGAELKKATDAIVRITSETSNPSVEVRDAALDLFETYVATKRMIDPNDEHPEALPMSNITAIMARIAHDWPDDERAVATIPGGDDIGAWSRLTNAYGVAARFRGYEKSGAASARILRGAAAAAAAREETCNAPVTVRAIETDAEPRARLYTRATYSGTPAGFHAAMNDAANPWPAEVPKFSVVGAIHASGETHETVTKIKSDRCATFSAGAIPSTAFSSCADDSDRDSDSCGLPIIASDVVASFAVVDEFYGQIDTLDSLRVRVTLTSRLGAVTRDGATHASKVPATHAKRLYCATLDTVSADGAGSLAEKDVAWRTRDDAGCEITSLGGDAYACECSKLGAVTLAVAGPWNAEEWGETTKETTTTTTTTATTAKSEGENVRGSTPAPAAPEAPSSPVSSASTAVSSEHPVSPGPVSPLPVPSTPADAVTSTTVTATYAITGMSAAKAEAQLNFVENVVKSRLSRGIKFHSLAPSRVSAEMSADGTSATLVLRFTGFVGKDPRGVKRFSQMAAGPRTMRAVNVIMKKRGSLVVSANYKTDSVISWSDGHVKALRGRIGGLIKKAKSAAAAGNQAARANFARGIAYFKRLLNGPPTATTASLGGRLAAPEHDAATLPAVVAAVVATVVAAAALFVVTRKRRGHAGGRRGGGGADEKTAFVAAANDYGASGSWA